MKGLILLNAYSSLEHSIYQAVRLKEEFSYKNINVDVLRNDFFAATLDSNGNIKKRLANYDFCIYLDKDKYISYMLEKLGLRLFNTAKAIEDGDDKRTTMRRRGNNSGPMPKTLPGLLCYSEDSSLKESVLDVAENELGYPLIVKSSYGSMGSSVYKADNRDELKLYADYLRFKPHLFQEFIKESAGRDIRIMVIGGKTIAYMERYSTDDFRSNISAGGFGKKIDLPAEVEDIALKAAKILHLDYCGVDILIGKDKYYLCEVNSNAFFQGLEEVTGINVAGAYVEHVLRVL